MANPSPSSALKRDLTDNDIVLSLTPGNQKNIKYMHTFDYQKERYMLGKERVAKHLFLPPVRLFSGGGTINIHMMLYRVEERMSI